jgi:hypothetical protein
MKTTIDIPDFVARSKLALERIRGDFSEGALTKDSKEFVVVRRRPSAR